MGVSEVSTTAKDKYCASETSANGKYCRFLFGDQVFQAPQPAVKTTDLHSAEMPF